MKTTNRLILLRTLLFVATILICEAALAPLGPSSAFADSPVPISFDKLERDRIIQHSPLMPPPVDARTGFKETTVRHG